MKRTFGVKEVEIIIVTTLWHDVWYLLRFSQTTYRTCAGTEELQETVPITYLFYTINTGNL